MKYTYEFSSAKHKRDIPKPSEDRVFVDGDRGIFVVLDGITRLHSEYEADPGKSAVCDVNEIFLGAVIEYLSANIDGDPELILRAAARLGNEGIREYRKGKTLSEWGFYPGTLGVIAILRGSRLHFLCAGDCIAAVVRKTSRLFFGAEPALEAIDKDKPSKEDRYRLYCNHPESPLGYTIFNGDEGAQETACYSYIDLSCGDRVLMASDGISSLVKYERISALKALSAEEMIAASARFDVPPFAEYADDKSIIVIDIK